MISRLCGPDGLVTDLTGWMGDRFDFGREGQPVPQMNTSHVVRGRLSNRRRLVDLMDSAKALLTTPQAQQPQPIG